MSPTQFVKHITTARKFGRTGWAVYHRKIQGGPRSVPFLDAVKALLPESEFVVSENAAKHQVLVKLRPTNGSAARLNHSGTGTRRPPLRAPAFPDSTSSIQASVMEGPSISREIDLTPLDTLTVKFCRDAPGPLFKGPYPKMWCAYVGENWIEGCGGFGKTPLLALQDLCHNLEKNEDTRTDSGVLPVR